MKNLYCIFEIQLNNIFSNEYDQSSTNVGPLKKHKKHLDITVHFNDIMVM